MHRPETRSYIQFTIIGAGIAGLTAAYRLHEAGYSVRVLEQQRPDSPLDGGLRVPPNMSRLLEELPGGTELLEAHGTQCSGISFIDGNNGEFLGRAEFTDEIMSDLGGHFYMVPSSILITHLREVCQAAGIEIRFSVQVASIQLCAERKPVVVTATGERIESDVLVGADGYKSVVRDALLQQQPLFQNDDTTPNTDLVDSDGAADDDDDDVLSLDATEFYGGTCTIPLSEFKDNAELAKLTSSTEYCIWPGTNLQVMGHRCGDLYLMSIIRISSGGPEFDWNWILQEVVINEQDAFVLGNSEPKIQGIISKAKYCHRTIQKMVRIPSLTDAATSVALIGDASHTVPMHCTHNSSAAVEDSFALAYLFSKLETRDQIPFFLRGYSQMRYPRSEARAKAELSTVVASTFPPGPLRNARNVQLRHLSEVTRSGDTPEDPVLRAWQTYLNQFNYNATEEAEEWWMNWGRKMLEREAEKNVTAALGGVLLRP